MQYFGWFLHHLWQILLNVFSIMKFPIIKDVRNRSVPVSYNPLLNSLINITHTSIINVYNIFVMDFPSHTPIILLYLISNIIDNDEALGSIPPGLMEISVLHISLVSMDIPLSIMIVYVCGERFRARDREGEGRERGD